MPKFMGSQRVGYDLLTKQLGKRKQTLFSIVVVVVQSLSRVQLFATPRTEGYQPSLFFTISWSLLKLMSIESMIVFPIYLNTFSQFVVVQSLHRV